MSSQKIDQSRRGFLTAAFLAREGGDKIPQKQVRAGLMPPGLLQAVSVKNCNPCSGHCEQSCPQSIIKRHPAGHELMGQPFVDFKINGCTFCMDCNTACPSVNKVEIGLEKNQPGIARLSEQACYAWNNMICRSCINACEHQLIKFNGQQKPQIQLNKCTGCGFCIKTCPASAIEIVV